MRINFRWRGLWLVVASVGALALAGGIAYAAIPDNQGVIHGCRNNGSGGLRVIDSANASCTAAETPLNWNQTGPQGPPGRSPFAGYADGGNQQPVNCPANYNPVSWGLIPPSGATDPPLVRSVQFNLGSPTGNHHRCLRRSRHLPLPAALHQRSGTRLRGRLLRHPIVRP